MPEIKLTKNALRLQQAQLTQLQRYLPTLQLKKAMLQLVVNEVRQQILVLEHNVQEQLSLVSDYQGLLGSRIGIRWTEIAKVEAIERDFENIAGVDVPLYRAVRFGPFEYALLATPAWLDAARGGLEQLAGARAELIVAHERRMALEKELREVSIRVNLFEKNLIPKAERNIKKIKIFLGDQQLAAVAQAKVAKGKILKRLEREESA